MTDTTQAGIIRRLAAYMVGLWRQPHWWAESWSAIVTVAWALISLFGKPLSERPSYDALTSFAPSEVWVALALGAGTIQLTALTFNSRWLRVIGSALCAWFFTTVLWFFIKENNFPPAMSLYGGYIGINLMAMYKLARGTA